VHWLTLKTLHLWQLEFSCYRCVYTAACNAWGQLLATYWFIILVRNIIIHIYIYMCAWTKGFPPVKNRAIPFSVPNVLYQSSKKNRYWYYYIVNKSFLLTLNQPLQILVNKTLQSVCPMATQSMRDVIGGIKMTYRGLPYYEGIKPNYAVNINFAKTSTKITS